MLNNTFSHIPGISRETEEKIWKNNCLSWKEFLDCHEKINIGDSKKKKICNFLKASIQACNNNDYYFLCESIPSNMHWRAYPDLKKKCCFLDIETTGLSNHHDEITVIGLYDGKNMDEFAKEIEKYDMIVTFNGKCFDVPFIKSKFPSVDLDKFHVDLRYAMREIGYSGGLKRIEKEIGINRSDDISEVDGYEAVRLWYKYKNGDESALDLLIKYNIADIENLKVMMEFAFEKLKEKNFLSVIN